MPATSLALLSWSEQVSQPHARCSKGSPLREAPIRCYSYPHLPHGTLPARNSPSSLLHSHTTSFGNRFSITPCLGDNRSCVPHQDSLKPANKDPGALQPFPCVQRSPPSSMPWLSERLSHGAAPFHGQSSQVGSPACKRLDWIKPKSTSQRVPKSRLWDYKG